MWPFKRRNKAQENVPQEVQEYYQAEKRERMGLAWALAFITLAVTVGVVLGLFFGGRALYRHVNNKTKTATTQSANTENQNQANQSTNSTESSQSSSANNSSSSNNQSSQSSSSNSTSSSSSSTSQPSQPSSNTSSQAGKGAIVNTGPGETAAASFTIASVVGFGLYEIRLRRKLEN